MWATPNQAFLASPPLCAGLHFLRLSSWPMLPLLRGRRRISVPHDSYPHENDPLIQQLIRKKARRLTGRARLSPEDIEDLAQDFRAELLEKLSAYDPCKRPMPAFIRMLLSRFFAKWLRHRFADMRNPRRVVSLNMLVHNDEGLWIELGKTIAQGVHGRRHGLRLRSDQEHADLRNDLDSVLQGLTHELRAVADQLMDKTVTAAARELGIPRTTLHERVRQLRQNCDRKRLRDFL
jgi:RNA polymerase sigma factor (sigma-70 family)